MTGMCVSSFRRDSTAHRLGPVALVTWWLVAVGLISTFGVWVFLCAQMIPSALASCVGAYLFYAQHNFPDAVFKDRREWDYHFAALHSSSMFDMSAVMHWFTREHRIPPRAPSESPHPLLPLARGDGGPARDHTIPAGRPGHYETWLDV